MAIVSLPNSDDETDALFRTDPLSLSRRFAQRAIRLMREGRDPYQAARLAGTYAFMADPSLRLEAPRSDLAATLWRFATELNQDFADRLKRMVH